MFLLIIIVQDMALYRLYDHSKTVRETYCCSFEDLIPDVRKPWQNQPACRVTTARLNITDTDYTITTDIPVVMPIELILIYYEVIHRTALYSYNIVQ